MIQENEIPGIVESINSGGVIPLGVEPIHLNRRTLKYTYIYFDGLGVFNVINNVPEMELNNEDSLILKQQNNA